MHSDLSKRLLEFLDSDEKQAPTDSKVAQVFSDAVSGSYEEFVNKLKGWAGDPKITAFLQSGLKDGLTAEDKFTVSSGSIPCSALIPTQNEIDLNKSLDYPLKDPASMKKYLDGGEIVIGGPIITFNGKYIIDGHHRWSQVYCINPSAKMKVLNFKHSGLSPEDMLKATQVAIAATSGEVQVSTVEGYNLLKISLEQIYEYIVKNINPECAKLMSKTKEGAAKKIALNCRQMQKNNQPIKGAPARGFMPQTDEPKGNINNVVKALSSGITQVIEPFTKQTNSEPMKQESKQMNKKVLKEWDPSMSNDPSAPFNQSDYDGYFNKLAVLALKDKSLNVTPDSLPKIKESEIETWLDIADPQGKIWSKYESKIKPKKGTFTDPKMMLDDMEGYENAMVPLIYPYYKLAIHKARKEWEAVMADEQSAIKQQKKQMGEGLMKEFTQETMSKKTELKKAIIDKLKEGGLKEIQDNKVSEFIDANYDLLGGVVDTIVPRDLVRNYVQFVNRPESTLGTTLTEALTKLLKEDDSVEQADPVMMFQDFSDISGSLADIYSTLVTYQTSYVSNPKVQQAIGTIMSGVNQLMKQSTATMQMLGQSFGMNEAQIKGLASKKKLNEGLDINKMENWTETEWAAFENLSAMQKMEIANKSDYFKQLRGPKVIQQVIAAAKKWAKAGGYKNWERVATTQAGKRSIIYQFVKQIPTISHFQMSELIEVLDDIVKYWR